METCIKSYTIIKIYSIKTTEGPYNLQHWMHDEYKLQLRNLISIYIIPSDISIKKTIL